MEALAQSVRESGYATDADGSTRATALAVAIPAPDPPLLALSLFLTDLPTDEDPSDLVARMRSAARRLARQLET